jgi:hypothetical protein
MGLVKQEIGDLSLYLQQLPDINETRRQSAQEVVAELKKDIISLQKRGYTLHQIADAIKNGSGMAIAPQTLKSYLQRARDAVSKKNKRKAVKPLSAELLLPNPIKS